MNVCYKWVVNLSVQVSKYCMLQMSNECMLQMSSECLLQVSSEFICTSE